MLKNPDAATPKPTRLEDYRPSDYLIETVDLDFALSPDRTLVAATLVMRRASTAAADAPLILDGEEIDLLSVGLDGEPLAPSQYEAADNKLTIRDLPASFTLTIKNTCAPAANTALSGLYLSNDMFCTQCEAEGFRRITYYLDRPDILAKFTVRMEAEKAAFPVLLSNGNQIEKGDLSEGRHFARWADPFPKPAYLFALVAGDLACVEDSFTTVSGRKVALKVFVQPQNTHKCDYTLDALKRAMRWDEETFGREYDLDIFMIVAVDHFNFGAMENKGLNIFNSAYVLASPETATDQDYETIESIVAHEYFHNWSGNRVTCRDWFQLCLKEGFTVFRDQEFSADMRSRPVQRIKDVRRLWAHQFPEDDGPLAHPPRPHEFITIDNFYTATVYEKGAELARMLKLLLGEDNFRKASDLYFERHDGTAATVEDFVCAMEEASGRDLTQFRRWYADAGRPTVSIGTENNEITVTQNIAATPGQSEKLPRHIPIDYAAYGAKTGAVLQQGLIELTGESQTICIDEQSERPVLSFLNGFSAPVSLDQNLSVDDRLVLMKHDRDAFSRWSVTHGLWKDLCLSFGGVNDGAFDKDAALDRFTEALDLAIGAADEDPAFTAELLKTPTAAELTQTVDTIDPDKITSGRRHVRSVLATALKQPLRRLYDRLHNNASYSPDAADAGPRTLKNTALGLLVDAGEDPLALTQATHAAHMSDEAAATAALATSDSPLREMALDRFYSKWRADPLVVNKWLAWRAMAPGPDALHDIQVLLSHDAFDAGNPNKVRALIGVFARENLANFHRADGEGYRFFADQILSIDKKNPQLAARLCTALEFWRKLEPRRKAQAEKILTQIAEAPGLSSNLYEMTAKL